MAPNADAGAAAKQAPSERARNPTPGAPDGVGAEAGRQELGHVAGLLGRQTAPAHPQLTHTVV